MRERYHRLRRRQGPGAPPPRPPGSPLPWRRAGRFRRAHRGGPRGHHHEPGQGVLPRTGRHEARPRQLLPRRRGTAHAHDGRPARAPATVPQRGRRLVVLPEAGARAARPSGWRRRSSRRRTARRRGRWSWPISPTSLWAVNLGCLGFHVWPCAPTTRARRRAAHRPRSAAGHHVRRWCGGGWVRAGAARRARHLSATRRPPATGGSTSTCGSSRGGIRYRCVRPPSPPPASSSAADPT